MKKIRHWPKNYRAELKGIGEKLYSLRLARNESLQKASRNMKVSPAILSKIEKGQQNFRLSTFFRICIYYQVEPRDVASS